MELSFDSKRSSWKTARNDQFFTNIFVEGADQRHEVAQPKNKSELAEAV